MMVNHTKYAIISPSSQRDLDYCNLMCESVDRFVNLPFKHYVIVDERDSSKFQHLRGTRREVVTVEEILPWWIKRLPLVKRWWLSFRSLPIRNWLLQQLVKISFPLQIEEENLIYVDTDIAFIRPTEIKHFERNGSFRLFCIPDGANMPSHYKWHHTASRLLDLPVLDYHGARFIGSVINWKKSNVVKLVNHIEQAHRIDWRVKICNEWHFSEYILYGVYVTKILSDRSGHFIDPIDMCLNYWDTSKLSPSEENKFCEKLESHHIAVMINAKARMPIEQHRRIVKKLEIK